MNSNYVAPLLSYSLNHLWQSTLFAAVAFLVIVTLLRHNSARCRYWVWMAASLKFLIPFAALMDLGRHFGWLRLAPQRTQINLYYAADELSRRAAPQLTPSALVPKTAAAGSSVPDLLAVIWACGVLFLAVRWWLSWRRVREATHGATLLRMFEGIPVLSSPSLRERGLEPGVVGLCRPVVVVPEGIAERLGAAELDAVLAHESFHVRSRDNLAASVHMAVEAIFWFHPLVWWLGHRIMQERERACDESVLRRRNNPEEYAQGILNVCKFYLESPLPCVSGITGSNLKQRIEEIMTRRLSRELNVARSIVLAVAGFVSVMGPVAIGLMRAPLSQAQATSNFDGRIYTSASKQFEVATVKENRSGEDRWSFLPAHGTMSMENLPLHKILASSFQTQDLRVFGPSWIDSARYDIKGKGDPTATNPEVWEMMRALLAERFHLKYHLETRQLPVYTLTVAKGGPKLRRPEDGQCAAAIKDGQSCSAIRYFNFGVGILNMPVGALTAALARRLQDRPIVDKTGLTGKYDIDVRWLPEGVSPDDLANVPPEERPPDVSLFTALEQQAGLKLGAEKGPVEVVVVDSIEKPTDDEARLTTPPLPRSAL